MKSKKVILILGVLTIIILFEYGVGIPCIFNRITGLYCPGCGTTRAIDSLIKLDFYQALRYNAITTILLPFSIVYCVYKYVIKGKKNIPNWVWYVILAFTLAYGVMRNIPVFSYLAPIQIR